jgi:hypothetical protein
MEPDPTIGSYSEPDELSSRLPTTSLRSILILSSRLRQGHPNGLFPSGFPTKILYAFLMSHACYMPRLFHPP